MVVVVGVLFLCVVWLFAGVLWCVVVEHTPASLQVTMTDTTIQQT